jgi:MYXO-CTERM domain-containing protein
MVEPYSPFFPASWHEKGKRFAIGLQSADVMTAVMSETGFDPALATTRLREELGAHAQEVERVAKLTARGTQFTYVGIDPTAATYADFASVGAAMEAFSEAPLGGSGTMTAARVITDAVQSLPVKQVGLRGLMLPVLEDARIAQRWAEGRLSLDSLLAYSAVCGTGLDTVPLPGSVTDAQLVRILGDVATLATKWNKPLTARLFPIAGLQAGDQTQFNNPYLVDTVLQPLPGAPQPASANDQAIERSAFASTEPGDSDAAPGCSVSASTRWGSAWFLAVGLGLLVWRRRREERVNSE